MQQEAELILKFEIFYEAWLFGYVPLSRDVGYARNLEIRIQGAHLYLRLWKLESCHMLTRHGIYFPQPRVFVVLFCCAWSSFQFSYFLCQFPPLQSGS